jgi:hypothetical protein
LSLWQGKRQEAIGKSEEGLGDFTFLYTVWFYCVHLLTVKQDWRGLLILRDRSQGLGWEVPYAELLERRVTQLYLSDLREQQELTPNLMLLLELCSAGILPARIIQTKCTTAYKGFSTAKPLRIWVLCHLAKV